LVENKEFYSVISQNAKLRAQDFNENKIVKEWEKVYCNLYNKKGS
jgi:hypothetical protein